MNGDLWAVITVTIFTVLWMLYRMVAIGIMLLQKMRAYYGRA